MNRIILLIATILLISRNSYAFSSIPRTTPSKTSSLLLQQSTDSNNDGSSGVAGIGNIFSNLFGGGSNQNQQQKFTRVIEIPTKSVKTGGLRFLLGIYLVSQQNKPTTGSWFPDTNTNEENEIDMYYKDKTAMCTLTLNEYKITVDRYGERPSLEYVLQESILLHGLLDEIENCIFGMDDIDEENRLVQLSEPRNQITLAREKLPARAE